MESDFSRLVEAVRASGVDKSVGLRLPDGEVPLRYREPRSSATYAEFTSQDAKSDPQTFRAFLEAVSVAAEESIQSWKHVWATDNENDLRGIPVRHSLMAGGSFPSVLAGADGAPEIVLGRGFFLALDDAILACLGARDFLYPDAALRTEDPPVLYVVGFDGELETRFFDYSTLTRAGEDWKSLATFWMPAEDWRLRQMGLLRDLCVQFAMLHELVHWALGHAGFVSASAPAVFFEQWEEQNKDAA